jgi:hypothetical protein
MDALPRKFHPLFVRTFASLSLRLLTAQEPMSHVIAGRIVPLLVISPLFVTQVEPTM